MTFTPTQKELFNKNIEALSNILLKESLKEIKSSKFEPVSYQHLTLPTNRKVYTSEVAVILKKNNNQMKST
ncbi:hypothetical protein ACISOT_06660, partial [Campylobacter jejuni]